MSKSIDFYFDFISPYSFLAHKRIKKIEKPEITQLVRDRAKKWINNPPSNFAKLVKELDY